MPIIKDEPVNLTDKQLETYEEKFGSMEHTHVLGEWVLRDDPYIFTLEDCSAIFHIHENEAGEPRAAACWFVDDSNRESDFVCRLCAKHVPDAVKAMAKTRMFSQMSSGSPGSLLQYPSLVKLIEQAKEETKLKVRVKTEKHLGMGVGAFND